MAEFVFVIDYDYNGYHGVIGLQATVPSLDCWMYNNFRENAWGKSSYTPA